MKLTFLGTGGSRFVMIKQIRATGGFILEIGNQMFHVDPGPGALVRALQNKIKLEKLTGVLVSHAHIDHALDAQAIIEAMTAGTIKKKGVMLADEYVFHGDKEGMISPYVGKYHLNALESYHVMEPGKTVKVGDVEITATKTKHKETKCVGFVFRHKETLGYTSDGEYFQGMEDYFKGCNYLVVNCSRPRGHEFPDHMSSADAKKLVEKIKPNLCFITHLGMKMLRGVAEKEAKWIFEETGVKTIAARDGLSFEPGPKERGLRSFTS